MSDCYVLSFENPSVLAFAEVPIAEVPIAIAAERAENTPSISVVPDTPTKVSALQYNIIITVLL